MQIMQDNMAKEGKHLTQSDQQPHMYCTTECWVMVRVMGMACMGMACSGSSLNGHEGATLPCTLSRLGFVAEVFPCA